jgi:allantoinase
MSQFDLVIRNGNVVNATKVREADIAIEEGRIVAIGPGLPGSTRETIDATGLHIFPGLIDSHVHFNEPGRADWEGFETGSRALAAGGGTLFFDMPLNAHPPTLDGPSFDQKAAAAAARSLVDFALWGGLVPDNLDQLEQLSARGVVGFKAFMTDSGIDDFPCVDDQVLRAGMKRAARLNRIVAVHAESAAITQERTQQHQYHRQTGVADFLDSRPVHAELDAIGRALELAGETGCALHIVHVSCGAGVALIASARSQGVDVSCETCPHYLVLTDEDQLALGAVAKCAPPLRPRSAQDALWQYVRDGEVNTIGSDHSPSPPDMKTDPNFFKVWGGISGVQHTLPLLLTEARGREQVSLPSLARLTAFNVAQRFRLPANKNCLATGADADLALVDLRQSFTVKAEELFYRHRHSPYVGRTLTGAVTQTILRGRTIYKDGKIVSQPMGRLVSPDQSRRATANH